MTSEVIKLHAVIGDGIILDTDTVLRGAEEWIDENKGEVCRVTVLVSCKDGAVEAFTTHGRRDTLCDLQIGSYRLMQSLIHESTEE